MTTLRKSESARANGAKSRGPTIPEGKLASSQNATQHSIFSRTMILECESQHRFEQVLAAAVELEMARVESGNDIASQTAAADLRPVVLATLPCRSLSGNNLLDKIHRYETPVRRSPGCHPKNAVSGTARRQRFRIPPIKAVSTRPAPCHLSHRSNLHGPSAPREKVILQKEPTAQNET